jgi:hypothetical protein
MKKIKEFKIYDKIQNLNEIYQSSGMRFALMSAPKDGNLQSCPWVKCRDYIHDAFRAFLHKESCKIYGFSYNYNTDPPIDTRRIRLLVKNSNKSQEDLNKDIKSGVKLINHYEVLANIKSRTNCYEVNPGIWIVNGPNFWFKSPALTSMFTFLLRLGEYNLVFEDNIDLEKQFKKIADKQKKDANNDNNNNDAQYLQTTWDKMATLIENYEEIFLKGKRYEKCVTQKKDKLTVTSYHNFMGIVSFCNGNYKYKASSDTFKKIINEKFKKEDQAEIKNFEPLKVVKKEPINTLDKKKKVKKLIRIQTTDNKNIYENYYASSFNCTTVSSAKNGRKQCATLTYCREHMIASIRAALSEKCKIVINFPYRVDKEAEVDMEKTRFLVTVAGVDTGKGKIKKAWDSLFFAKKVLNTYEQFFGIEKSTISTVKLEHKEGFSTGWLFTSSKEWINNPVMFSIYVLIIRAAKNAADTLGTVDELNLNKLAKYWKKFYNYVTEKNKNTYLHLHHGSIVNIVQERKKLFITTPEKAYFADNGSSDVDYYKKVGIISLIEGKHLDEELNAKVKKLGLLQQ